MAPSNALKVWLFSQLQGKSLESILALTDQILIKPMKSKIFTKIYKLYVQFLKILSGFS